MASSLAHRLFMGLLDKVPGTPRWPGTETEHCVPRSFSDKIWAGDFVPGKNGKAPGLQCVRKQFSSLLVVSPTPSYKTRKVMNFPWRRDRKGSTWSNPSLCPWLLTALCYPAGTKDVHKFQVNVALLASPWRLSPEQSWASHVLLGSA